MKDLNNKKILIIRLSALGDTIHTLPLLSAIKKQYPNAIVDWIVQQKASKFILNNPLINKVYVLPNKPKHKEFWQIISEIQKENYDIVIDTQQLLKSGIILHFSKGKRKITLDKGREFSHIFANEIIKTGKELFDINFHVVERNLLIAKYLGCEDLSINFSTPNFEQEYSEEVKTTIENLDKTKKTIVLAPTTTWDNKHWIIQGWVDVIKEFENNYNIILTADKNGAKTVEEIITKSESKNLINLANKTTLSDLIYIFQNTDVLLSPDSGSAHVAWACGNCKIITLFFATSKNRTAPFGDNYYSFNANIDCAPCMSKKCRKNNKNECISKINSSEIINILKKVLQ